MWLQSQQNGTKNWDESDQRAFSWEMSQDDYMSNAYLDETAKTDSKDIVSVCPRSHHVRRVKMCKSDRNRTIQKREKPFRRP